VLQWVSDRDAAIAKMKEALSKRKQKVLNLR
jgi:hypothetical protein